MRDAPQLIVKLRKLLRSRGRSPDQADELIQEAFARLQTYCRGQAVRQTEAFLVRTALNLMIDEGRKSRTAPSIQGSVELLPLIDPAPTPEDVLLARERLQYLYRGLDELSPRVREVFLLHRLEGFSYAQIAKTLELSPSTVEKHIAKASLFLFDWMAKEDLP